MAKVMTNVALIIQQHREAAAKQRREHKDPEKARAFLVRAGTLDKRGKPLSKHYR